MRRDEDFPDEAEDSSRCQDVDTSGEEWGGFLIVKLRPGQTIQIGDSVVVVQKSSNSMVQIAVRARKSTLIRRLP